MRRAPLCSLVVASLMVVGGLVSGCGVGGANYGSSGSTTTSSSAALIHTKTVQVNGKSETVLANALGKTLYYFTPDATSVVCTGSCAQTWQPLLASSGTPTSAATLPGALSVVQSSNGSQVTYNGHPLYTYSQDTSSSDVNGQGIAGKWFVATPDLSLQTGPASGY